MRIAIVNDVALAIEAVRRVIVSGGRHELAWVATDGAQAVEMCLLDRPDLILMDLIMPRMDGVEATRQIMERAPCAILVVTANMTDNPGKVFEAMGAGALDAVSTPVMQYPEACKGANALLAKIDTIATLIGVPVARPSYRAGHRNQLASAPRNGCLVAVGASAGGPSALAYILARMPAEFPAPIVVVQHVDPDFAPGLASWLNDQTPLAVRLAHSGDRPQVGTVYLARGDQHLVLNPAGILGYADEPLDCSYRPSVDVFFASVNRWWEGPVLAVLLSGMGRDGAVGLRSLRAGGHRTLVQDQATSAVYGMPKAAVELDAVDEVIPLEQFAPRLLRLTAQAMNPKNPSAYAKS